MVLRMRSFDEQCQPHLGFCYKYKFLDPTPDILKYKLGRVGQDIWVLTSPPDNSGSC